MPRDIEHGAQDGRVDIVGAGPGAPDLLTLRARDLLAAADVVIHDRLVAPAILALAPAARLIEVGKTPGGPSWRQADIDALMLRHALSGARVVRLKSGDPALFGRLDEEMDALDAASVPFAICPGVTSATAAAASARVSLTRRRRNSSLRLLTGHDVDGFAEQDWRALAAPGATAAIYMGLRAAAFLRARLLQAGADPETPVTAVENASRAEERIVSAPLRRLPEALAEAALGGPAILFLGVAPRAEAADAFAWARLDDGFMADIAALRAAGDFF